MKKRVFSLLALLCLFFTSCEFLFNSIDEIFYDEVSLTIENDADYRVKIIYIDHDCIPEMPLVIEAGSSSTIEFSEKSGTFEVRFLYDDSRYHDTLFLSDGNTTYNIYLDSDSRLMVKCGGGRAHRPSRG